MTIPLFHPTVMNRSARTFFGILLLTPVFLVVFNALSRLGDRLLTCLKSFLALTVLLLTPLPSAMAAEPSAPATTTTASAPAFRHVVVFGFKEGTPASKVEEIATAFKALKGKIPAVKSFEWGLNDSPEKLNPELTHVFTLTFDSKESLEKNYLHHPEHLKFVELVKPHIAKAVVVDYVVK